MKIVYLAAGAAHMYCGSCLRDNTLARAIRGLGHDILLVPTYTPIRTDEQDVSEQRVFFGGINVFLQQKSALFRHTPWALDRVLDAPGLLRAVTRREASVRPESLGDLTVSMILGERGRQRKELRKLVHWLRRERPDVVHLSNAMMIGMARPIRELGIPVVCGLSGEDIFLEKLVEPFASRARQAMQERAGDAAAYVALNRFYLDKMIDWMAIAPERGHVVPIGLDLAGHGTRSRPAQRPECVIGYLARICPDKGLHLLVEAFVDLARRPGLPPLRLAVAGYLGGGDRAYFEEQVARLKRAGLADRLDHAGEPDRAGKIAFLQSLDVMCVPTVYRESKGMSLAEALANAVPIVVPAHGAFPELVADTGGGLLCRPHDAGSVADALAELILDPGRAAALGRQGQAAIRARYTAEQMAQRTLAIYRKLAADGTVSPVV